MILSWKVIRSLALFIPSPDSRSPFQMLFTRLDTVRDRDIPHAIDSRRTITRIIGRNLFRINSGKPRSSTKRETSRLISSNYMSIGGPYLARYSYPRNNIE